MKAIIQNKKYDTETAKLICKTNLIDGYFGGNPATRGERYYEFFKKNQGSFLRYNIQNFILKDLFQQILCRFSCGAQKINLKDI